MIADCCEFCGSFGDCHDSCIGKDTKPLREEIEKLCKENAKLRALVERGASFGLDRCCCAGGFESCFSCACKEALK